MPRVAPADPSSLFVSATEAAVLLGVGKETVYDLIARGELPCVRLGARVLLSRAVLGELAESPRAAAGRAE
jgi:excisionase family DNA binding protein